MASPAETAASGITLEEIENELLHWKDDKAQVVIIITTLFTACATIATIARSVTRRVILFAIGLYTEALLSVHYGTGKHVVRVGVDKKVKVTFALELTYNFCQLAIKASLLFLYKTVLTLENRRFRIAWYAVAFCVITLYTASILATVFQCIPTSYGWERLYATMEGHCVNLKAEAITTAVLSTLSDMSLLILPIPIVWGLQMPLKRKLGLLGIFLLGGFACVASIVRIVFLAKVHSRVDFTYVEVESLTWSIIEPCVGIICACLSTLRPLFRFLFRSSSIRATKKPQGSAWFSMQNRQGTMHTRGKQSGSKKEKSADRRWGLHHQRQRLGSRDGQTRDTLSWGLAANGVEMGRVGPSHVGEETSGHYISHNV